MPSLQYSLVVNVGMGDDIYTLMENEYRTRALVIGGLYGAYFSLGFPSAAANYNAVNGASKDTFPR